MPGRTKRLNRFQERYGPWAVVTGASEGIGREMALRLAEAGVNLALVARRRDRLVEMASRVASQWEIQTRVIVADLGNPEWAQHRSNRD